jgi:hypothetical protein
MNVLKLDKNACAKMLAEMLPDGKRLYSEHLGMYGEVLLHVLVGEMINIPLTELLKADREHEKIRLYCEIIEEMRRNGDEDVVNVVEVTVLEYLTDNREVWQCFGRHISDDLRRYINNEFIPANLNYMNAEKLKGK